MSVVIPNRQQMVRNCFAYGNDLGLMLVSNGEEKPYVLFPDGTIIDAAISAPPAPTVADNGTGNLPDTEWAVYAAVYVIEGTYPLIGARVMGEVSPFSTAFQINNGGVNRQNRITLTGSSHAAVNKIRIYRTDFHADQQTAELAAEAGTLYYLGVVDNAVGSITFDDNLASNIGNDPIEFDNFTAPQFRYCVYDGEYFWGFGNHPFKSDATWTSAGVITITDADKAFHTDGRNNQYVTFNTVTTGGIDGKGTFLFKYLSSTTAQTVDENGADLAIGADGSGNVVVCGETANLYRSKYKNPFAWGYMRAYVDEYVPERWAIKVSGGLGTAIAVFPDQNLLKLDIEFPAECVTYNLQTASTDIFETTRQIVSKAYSVTNHFSQFPAVSKGKNVLWGMDYKNFAIVESDGISQLPISGPISSILKSLAPDRILQMLSHGIYDPYTEINAIWVSLHGNENDSDFKNDLCIYNHAPTGFWGVISDYDISCSAGIEDETSSQKRILVGTESGFVGYAFQPGVFGNWLPDSGSVSGTITGVTSGGVSITTDKADISDDAVGNYVIIVSPDKLTTQVRLVYSKSGSIIGFNTPIDPLTPVGSEFFIGLIECSVLKYFDRGIPNLDKKLREIWFTLKDGTNPYIRFYPEHSETPTASFELKRDKELDAWFKKGEFPTTNLKTLGIEFLDHSYQPIRFYNMTLL